MLKTERLKCAFVCSHFPSRSPDLTPMDFFLWGYLKQQVNSTPPPTLQDLQRRITDACANVTPVMLHRVQRELQASVQMCIVASCQCACTRRQGCVSVLLCIVADGEKFEHRK
ncbi:hypothetical protein AVEN_128427-1 [Araneus ventricosus]|uniref:Uncharacterized protein n=1 Tax=Araneus ventricosus TaxID=182803 RepID=A0A4Y2GHD5_ARAVE|nr:hypothetical protein AVEN_128427-1 [Araneus ventricosus]